MVGGQLDLLLRIESKGLYSGLIVVGCNLGLIEVEAGAVRARNYETSEAAEGCIDYWNVM